MTSQSTNYLAMLISCLVIVSLLLVFQVVESFQSKYMRTSQLQTSCRSPWRLASPILAKKKSSGGGGGPASSGAAAVKSTVGTVGKSAKKGEIRVKLLADIKNQGKAGEVIFVSAAMYSNVLAPQKKATRVSDEENESNVKNALEDDKNAKANAAAQTEIIQAIKGAHFDRKVGANGKMFGVVKGKDVLDYLRDKKKIDLSPKALVTDWYVGDKTGAPIKGKEVKNPGTYTAIVNFGIQVEPAQFQFTVGDKALL